MNDNGEETPTLLRFRSLMPVGKGPVRQVFVELLGEGFDAVLTATVVYHVAEGFSREGGAPPGNPMRFHEGLHRHVGADLPAGLDADELRDRARDAMADPALFDGLEIGEIEDIALVIGRDIQRGAPPPRF